MSVTDSNSTNAWMQPGSILLVAGPVIFMSMQCSMIFTAIKIKKANSTLSYSNFPFICMFTNCVIWVLYGMLKQNYTVVAPNLTGVFAGAFAIGVYEIYSSTPPHITTYLLSLSIVVTGLTLYVYGDFFDVGLIGDALAALNMGAPLSVVGTVLRYRSTAAMPFYTSLAAWGNGLSWSLYGILIAQDPLVSILHI
jgi:solute carrier family 50 (sugar transporter)